MDSNLNRGRNVLDGAPNSAFGRSEQPKNRPPGGLTTLPMDWISEHSRLLASIRGFSNHHPKSQHRRMQVVDFHDFCRFLQVFADCFHQVFLHKELSLAFPRR
jgi:hypothetical protein